VPIVDAVTERSYDEQADEREPLEGERLRIAREFVETNRPTIEAAHAARESGAVARFPVEFEKLIFDPLRCAQAQREVVRLLQLDLEASLAAGDTDAAVESLLTILAASESLRNEPMVVSQIARFGLFDASLDSLSELLRRSEVTEDQIAQLEAAFELANSYQPVRAAMQGEPYMGVHLLRDGSPVDDPQVTPAANPFFPDADLAAFLDICRRLDEAASSESGQAAKLREVADGLEDLAAWRGDLLRYSATYLSGPMFSALADSSVRNVARARLAKAALALERWRNEFDEYPEGLAELPSPSGPADFVDPFDDQPLRYRREGDGYALYSIGADRRDDNGVDEFDRDVLFRQ
jgi:hypothetical protein